MLVSDLDYSEYLGRLAVGRSLHGTVRSNEAMVCVNEAGVPVPLRVTRLQAYEGLRLVDITEAMPGDIVIIAGMDDVAIGDTICTKENIRVLPRLRVDEPTVAMRFTINTSPLAGREGKNVQSRKIRDRLLKDAWVQDVSVNRIFPNTLELAVTERTIAAVVDVPTENAESTQKWAIASDGMWLMPIPAKDSEAGKKTSAKVYEDAESVLAITEVPYGTSPEVGAYCSDASVNNALAIVDGMTTELAGQVKKVAATETESTTLTLESGVEIVFGTADNIRDKERVCLEIMKEHPDGLAYINVRVVDRPTWRAL